MDFVNHNSLNFARKPAHKETTVHMNLRQSIFSILFLLYFACIRKLLPHRSLGNKQESQYKLSSPYAQVYLCLDLQPEINRMKFILINSTETIFVDHYFYVGLNPQERRLQKIKLIFQNYNMSYIHKVRK